MRTVIGPRLLSRFVLLGALLLPLTGCSRNFFRASGTISSDGGALGRWNVKPDGCSRDPFDGRPEDKTTSLATFLWEYTPARAEWGNRRAHHGLADRLPNGVPLRLEISRLPPGWTPHTPTGEEDLGRMELAAPGPPLLLSLNTHAVVGKAWSNAACRELEFHTAEEPPGTAGGRPALGGTLQMDCQVDGSRVRADLHFSRCDF